MTVLKIAEEVRGAFGELRIVAVTALAPAVVSAPDGYTSAPSAVG